jgi:hypothetical protein
MSAAEKFEAISDRLTWEQICECHPDEWVCLVEIEYAQLDDAIERARVVGHGKTKREPVEQAKVWWGQYATIGHFYTGKLRAPDPRFRVIVEDETRDALRFG